MSLLLTGTREHALLAMIVQEADQLGKQQGGYLGRTAMQKIPYFLQVLSVPMRYRFEIHHYGPFCDEITRDTEWLMADEVVVDQSSSPKYSNYRPGSVLSELISRHAGELEKYRSKIQAVVHALLPLEPEHLEMIATVDYAFRQLKASGGPRPTKTAVIERFVQIKGDKFPPDDVGKAFDQLAEAKLFDQ